MKILLFGKHGQLGWELHRTLQGFGQVLAYDYPEVDFASPSSLRRLLDEVAPRIVINAVAYTDVDRAESEPHRTRLINTESPGVLAEICRTQRAAFIHFSTDYVFDGGKGAPYEETDSTHPLNLYGQTKLAGEKAVLDVGGVNLIFRTAWVYSLRSNSFVTKVLRWAHNQREMRIVDDQVSNPTWARALAEIIAHLLAKAGTDPIPWLKTHHGLYHLAGKGIASRLDWAREIISIDPDAKSQRVNAIIPAKSGDFPATALRPRFSALDSGLFERTFKLRMPEWESSLRLAMQN